ncbi:MAG: nitronate monooxygenase [Ilumatobacteraceae bacterium]|jgi:enoyl-[acyl-carrier protein] reductase II|nr:nitronate monooxygenase [Ilumatobacteraceae bacterium]
MKTRITEMFDIELPVMLAGMGGVSYSDLVAAVSEAGGIGTFGAAPMSTELLISEMARVREMTKKPFGVDLLTASPDSIERNLKAIIEGGASIYVAGLGVPREIIDELHKHNILVGSMCGKVRHAVAAVASGCDFVVAQGTEAGGHTGTVATMALVPQVVDAVNGKVPVVAAGGIYDGRGLIASLALGAEAVWIGTKFIATHEAHTGNGYKEKMLTMAEDDTVISKAYTGKTCRVARTEWTEHFDKHPEELQGFPGQAIATIQAGIDHLGVGPETTLDVNKAFMAIGQAVGAIDEIVPAKQVVDEIMSQARETLERLASLR